MSDLLEKISDLDSRIPKGKAMEAFERHYHKEVIMQENDAGPTIGKELNRAKEEECYSKVSELNEIRPLKISAEQDITMVEWRFDYVHKVFGVCCYPQVSVQEWQEGQVISEKYYYNS